MHCSIKVCKLLRSVHSTPFSNNKEFFPLFIPMWQSAAFLGIFMRTSITTQTKQKVDYLFDRFNLNYLSDSECQQNHMIWRKNTRRWNNRMNFSALNLGVEWSMWGIFPLDHKRHSLLDANHLFSWFSTHFLTFPLEIIRRIHNVKREKGRNLEGNTQIELCCLVIPNVIHLFELRFIGEN